MRSGSRRAICALSLGALSASGISGLVGCGARTDLLLDTSGGGTDGGPAADEAAPDDATAGRDSGPTRDGSQGIDASHPDSGILDAGLPDAESDATAPPACPPGLTPPIYVITTVSNLYSFDPKSARFRFIGSVACPTTATPFSMAVSRDGHAYSVFGDGNLYRIDLASAACASTPYVAGQAGFSVFGMGFSANTPAPGETLYLVNQKTDVLATIDLTSFVLSPIGPVPGEAELTGTLGGQLYAFFPSLPSADMAIGRVDKASGKLTSTLPLSFTSSGGANVDWSFAISGGLFVTFTSDIEPTTVRLVDMMGDAKVLTYMNEVVVGAGVSTCASGN